MSAFHTLTDPVLHHPGTGVRVAGDGGSVAWRGAALHYGSRGGALLDPPVTSEEVAALPPAATTY